MRLRSASAVVALVVMLGAVAHAQPPPPALAATGVDEHVGQRIPLATPFHAPHRSGTVRIGDLFDGKRPVLLVLAYARCTMLCSLVLRGVIEVARKMTLSPDRDYQLVLVGLDDRETVDEASRKQAALLAELGRGAQPAAWPYLVGDRTSIDAVASALGFRYAWDARTEQYAHPAVIFAITPDGRISRYLHGIQFDPHEVATALSDAAAGRTISTAAVEVLRCFRFDPAARTAARKVQTLMRVGAGLIFAMLLATIVGLFTWERRRRRRP